MAVSLAPARSGTYCGVPFESWTARLVVIDPVSAALADVSTSETAGTGVLLVAYDTKSARNAIVRGEDPGAGVVAGSAAW